MEEKLPESTPLVDNPSDRSLDRFDLDRNLEDRLRFRASRSAGMVTSGDHGHATAVRSRVRDGVH